MGYAERSIRQLQSKFQKQAKRKRQKSVQSIFGTNSEALKSIYSLVHYQVITGGDVLGLKDEFNNYVSILKDLDTENLVASYTAQKLEEKLKIHFRKRIIIHKRKVQKRQLSHLQQQHHRRRSFETCWSSKIKTGSTYQRCCLIFKSYHQKRNPYKSPFKWY